MREGVRVALSLRVNNIYIEGDNLIVINSLRKCLKMNTLFVTHVWISLPFVTFLSTTALGRLIKQWTFWRIWVIRARLYITGSSWMTCVPFHYP